MFKLRHNKKNKREALRDKSQKSKAAKAKRGHSKSKPADNQRARRGKTSKGSSNRTSSSDYLEDTRADPDEDGPGVEQAYNAEHHQLPPSELNPYHGGDMNGNWSGQQPWPRHGTMFWQNREPWEQYRHQGYPNNEQGFRPHFQQWRPYNNQGMQHYPPQNMQNRAPFWNGGGQCYRGQWHCRQPSGMRVSEGWLGSSYNNREAVASRPTDSGPQRDRASASGQASTETENVVSAPPTDACAHEQSITVKQEMMTEKTDTARPAGHLIFLSSEDEDATPEDRKKKEGQTQQSESSSSVKHKVKSSKSSGKTAGKEQGSKRGSAAPASSTFASKEAFRKDVLDRLLNYPCSRRVRSQLSKWVAQMKGPHSQLPAQQQEKPQLNLATLSAEQLDLQGLVKEMEASDLPDDLLQSLMVALEDCSDAEQEGTAAASADPKTSECANSAATNATVPKVNGAKASKKSPVDKAASKASKAKEAKHSSSRKSSSESSSKAQPSSSSKSSAIKSETAEPPPAKQQDNTPATNTTPSKVAAKNPSSSKLVKSQPAISKLKCSKPGTVGPGPTESSSSSAISPPLARDIDELPVQEHVGKVKREGESDEECVVLPTPEKVILSVNLVDSEEDVDDRTTVDDNEEEDTWCASPVAENTQMPAALNSEEETARTQCHPPTSKSAEPTPALDTPRPSSEPVPASQPRCPSVPRPLSAPKLPSCPLPQPLQSGTAYGSTTALQEADAVVDAEPGPSLSSSSTPSGIPGPHSEDSNRAEGARSLHSPLLQKQATVIPGPLKEESKAGVAEESPHAIVSELIALCKEEEEIRSQCELAQQTILSLTTTLEQWKLKHEQLVSRETKIRKRRLELLCNLQDTVGGEQRSHGRGTAMEQAHILEALGAASTVPPPSVPAHSAAADAADVRNAAVADPPAGVTYLGALDTTLDIMQQILPHMQQLGDVPLPDRESLNQASMNTGSVFVGVQSAKPVAKRKRATDSSTRQKKTRQGRAESENDVDPGDCRLKDLEIKAHDGPVVAVKLHKGYVYTCSTDCTAKQFDLMDPAKSVIYGGHSKALSSLEVHSSKSAPTLLYTCCKDGYLRCFHAHNGDQILELDLESPIGCSASAWGRLFLGLHSGYVAVFNLKGQQVVEKFACSDGPVGRLLTAAEGAQRLLCTLSADGKIGVRDAATGLLLRYLGSDQSSPSTPVTVRPPACLALAGGHIYTAASDRNVFVHELRTGSLQKIYEAKSSATGLRLYKSHLLCCSFDGLVRCYRLRDFVCELVYYGAGKNMVMCMDTTGPLIATGNRKGLVELVTFDKSKFRPCEVGSCRLQFGREDDLVYHLKREHLALGAPAVQSHCPWQQCNMAFSGPTSSKDFEKHLMDHACT